MIHLISCCLDMLLSVGVGLTSKVVPIPIEEVDVANNTI